MKRSQAPSRVGFVGPRTTATPVHKTEPIIKKQKTDVEDMETSKTEESSQNTETESTPTPIKGDHQILKSHLAAPVRKTFQSPVVKTTPTPKVSQFPFPYQIPSLPMTIPLLPTSKSCTPKSAKRNTKHSTTMVIQFSHFPLISRNSHSQRQYSLAQIYGRQRTLQVNSIWQKGT